MSLAFDPKVDSAYMRLAHGGGFSGENHVTGWQGCKSSEDASGKAMECCQPIQHGQRF